MTVEELYSPCKQVLVVRSCEGSWLSPDNIRDSVTGDFGTWGFSVPANDHAVRLEFEQAGPAEIRRVQNYLGEPRLVWAANLDKPAEAHFSTRLQAQQLFASVTRGEVDFTSALHPSL
jgi:hypothetical protein